MVLRDAIRREPRALESGHEAVRFFERLELKKKKNLEMPQPKTSSPGVYDPDAIRVRWFSFMNLMDKVSTPPNTFFKK